jgi:hypothetical protein
MRGISRIAEVLLASLEGLCSMELVIRYLIAIVPTENKVTTISLDRCGMKRDRADMAAPVVPQF